MKVGSLFAGIGGFDLAAERVGMEVAWQSENDPHASRVLDHHWPDVKNYGDIHEIKDPPTVDVLTGGFPCQDYSVAGQRDGLAGDRGALWWEYHRLISSVRPTWVVGENVPGLLSSRSGQDFEVIVGSLTELGYGVAWAVLDAQYFGVAQRRRRVFIVGHIGGIPRPEVLAVGEGVFGHPAPRRKPGANVTGSLAARTTAGGGLGTDADLDGALIAMTVTAGTGLRYDAETETLVAEPSETIQRLREQAGLVVEEPVLSTLVARYGREYNNDGRVVPVGTGVRRLTPRECERLQGFPDDWTDVPGASDTQRYRQLGNAVAVPVVEWLLTRIMEAS